MMGGYNHSDIEPLTADDTGIMKELFGGSWTWTPRPVLILKGDYVIAGSLSGMPHSTNTVNNNGVEGHFDLYMHNASPHGSHVSQNYVKQHREAVLKAAGQ